MRQATSQPTIRPTIRPPFPYFGGKRLIASQVWERLGNVGHYIEPFFGSGAVLFSRPTASRIETVNDLDGYIANFWRAVTADPVAVATHADWPVSELDLHARHAWLIRRKSDLTELLLADPGHFDAQAAGWWVWGISQWIGSGWCVPLKGGQRGIRQRPDIGNRGAKGVHRSIGVHPQITPAGMGVHRKRPHLAAGGKGIHALTKHDCLAGWFTALQSRLRGVRVCCGDWKRVVSSAAMNPRQWGSVGVFLDPPYSITTGRKAEVYAEDCGRIADDVVEWAIEHGHDRRLRIAVCGLIGEHEFPPTWTPLRWKGGGGYANFHRTSDGKERARMECVWFSPGCLCLGQQTLFERGV